MGLQRIALLAVLVGAPSAAMLVGPASAGSATAGNALSGRVALPGPGQALVDEFTLTASVPSGKVGSLHIRSTNESQLPPGIRAVAATSPRSSNHRSATFTFFIAINNLTLGSTATAAQEVVLDYQVYGFGPGIIYKDRTIRLKALSCEELKNEGDAIDLGFKSGAIFLTRLQRKGEQPSPDESVFDFSAANRAKALKPPCPVGPGGVEAPDLPDN